MPVVGAGEKEPVTDSECVTETESEKVEDTQPLREGERDSELVTDALSERKALVESDAVLTVVAEPHTLKVALVEKNVDGDVMPVVGMGEELGVSDTDGDVMPVVGMGETELQFEAEPHALIESDAHDEEETLPESDIVPHALDEVVTHSEREDELSALNERVMLGELESDEVMLLESDVVLHALDERVKLGDGERELDGESETDEEGEPESETPGRALSSRKDTHSRRVRIACRCFPRRPWPEVNERRAARLLRPAEVSLFRHPVTRLFVELIACRAPSLGAARHSGRRVSRHKTMRALRRRAARVSRRMQARRVTVRAALRRRGS